MRQWWGSVLEEEEMTEEKVVTSWPPRECPLGLRCRRETDQWDSGREECVCVCV